MDALFADSYIIQQIVSNLSIDEQAGISRTCKQFNNVVHETGFKLRDMMTDKELPISECLKMNPRNIMLQGAYNNSRALINYAIKHRSNDWLVGLFGACGGGHDELIDEMFQKCKKMDGYCGFDLEPYGVEPFRIQWCCDNRCMYDENIWRIGMMGACFKHQLRIIERLNTISTDRRSRFICACMGGHMDLVQLYKNEIAGYGNLDNACFGGNLDIVKFVEKRYHPCAEPYEEAMHIACFKGHLNVIQYLCTRKETFEWSKCFEYASRGGNKEVIDFVCKKIMSRKYASLDGIVYLQIKNKIY